MVTRYPVVSGMFYYGDPLHLKRHLEELFSGTKPGNCTCVISPHAGYEYSGKTAAHAIASLKRGKKFIILGPNHTGMGTEFSVMSSGKWRTPLGDCVIDQELAGRLTSCRFLEEDFLAHEREHSIEVQLPLLQHRFHELRFVPITIMALGYSAGFLKKCDMLGEAVAKVMKRDKNIRVVVSSDFSHYIPEEEARVKDDMVIQMIRELDPGGFFRTLAEVNASVCGYAPIAVMIYIAKHLRLKSVRQIHYSTSGDVTRDISSVVTYAAIGFR